MSKGFSPRPSNKRPNYTRPKIDYADKDIGMVIDFIRNVRAPLLDELFEQVLREFNLLTRLERTGDYWKNQPIENSKLQKRIQTSISQGKGEKRLLAETIRC